MILRKHYRKYRAGLKHKLVICFKLLKTIEIEEAKKSLRGIKFETYIDYCKKKDWDLGSYKRIAKKHYNKDILFLNSHSYPICDNWIKKLFFYKKEKILLLLMFHMKVCWTQLN